MIDVEIEYRIARDEWEEKQLVVRTRRGAGAVRDAAILGVDGCVTT
jgi:hypothetical protein